jgi:ketose-bisphosphate aldolase
MERNKPVVLKGLLEKAQRRGYAVGSFNCRYKPMVRAVLEAAQECSSPVSIQISQKEISWFDINLHEFVDEVLRCVYEYNITIPYSIHLDHTWDFGVIKSAISAGFTSVMIDASKYELDENIARTKQVVDYAHEKGVTVEAELGKIGSADKLETGSDETMYTVPGEAKEFVEKSGADYLAVSIGTAHGVYAVRNPKIDFDRLREIRKLVSIPLVLHGGTGVPEESIKKAINIEGGGISKVNIATELEIALLESVGRSGRMTPADIASMDNESIDKARLAVKNAVKRKIQFFLRSADTVGF